MLYYLDEVGRCLSDLEAPTNPGLYKFFIWPDFSHNCCKHGHKTQYFSLCMGMILANPHYETVEELLTGDAAMDDEECTSLSHSSNPLQSNLNYPNFDYLNTFII